MTEIATHSPEPGQRGEQDASREPALQALSEGIAIDQHFLSAAEAQRLGEALSRNLNASDTVGIPINTAPEASDAWNDELQLAPEQRAALHALEIRLADLACDAAGVEHGTLPPPTSEFIRYDKGDTMDWHTDNYEPKPDLGEGLEQLGVLNGVVTLSGSADYFWKDPETGEVRQVTTEPGTLVLTRSGDLGDLKQVEHSVGPPKTDEHGQAQRVALLVAWG